MPTPTPTPGPTPGPTPVPTEFSYSFVYDTLAPVHKSNFASRLRHCRIMASTPSTRRRLDRMALDSASTAVSSRTRLTGGFCAQAGALRGADGPADAAADAWTDAPANTWAIAGADDCADLLGTDAVADAVADAWAFSGAHDRADLQ